MRCEYCELAWGCVDSPYGFYWLCLECYEFWFGVPDYVDELKVDPR